MWGLDVFWHRSEAGCTQGLLNRAHFLPNVFLVNFCIDLSSSFPVQPRAADYPQPLAAHQFSEGGNYTWDTSGAEGSTLLHLYLVIMACPHSLVSFEWGFWSVFWFCLEDDIWKCCVLTGFKGSRNLYQLLNFKQEDKIIFFCFKLCLV